VIGIQEKFDESLHLFKKEFGWKNIFYIKRNTGNKNHTSSLEIDNIKNLITEKNEYDIDLYKYADSLLNELIEAQGKNFNDELKRFKFLNKLYSKYKIFMIGTRKIKNQLYKIYRK